MLIKLAEFLKDPKDPYFLGNAKGREVLSKLQAVVDAHPEIDVFGVSLKGIAATDASFPRESVITLAKQYKGEKGFYLCDFTNEDLRDNWGYAATAKSQAMVVKWKNSYLVVGLELSNGLQDAFDFIMKEGSSTTSAVAEQFKLTPQNANAKLKKLMDMGLLLGRKEAAETGGLEYVFRAIK